jgi:hypothetical protein
MIAPRTFLKSGFGGGEITVLFTTFDFGRRRAKRERRYACPAASFLIKWGMIKLSHPNGSQRKPR